MYKKIICSFLAAALIISMVPFYALADETDTDGEPSGSITTGDGWSYDGDTGHYYEFVDKSVTYEQAAADIEQADDGGYLVIITDDRENDTAHSAVNKTNGQYWIGLSGTTDNKWVWANGEVLGENDYCNNSIYSAQTDENQAVRVEIGGSLWVSTPKTQKCNYIVEYNYCPHHPTQLRGNTYNCLTGGYTGDTYCLACGECVATGHEGEIKDSHSFTTNDTKIANCFVDGYSGNVSCKDCGYVSEEGQTIHIEHEYDKSGVCTKCGMITGAKQSYEYNADFSKVVFNVLTFTPEKNGSYIYSSEAVDCDTDTYAYLYNSYDLLKEDIKALYSTPLKTYNDRTSSMTHSVADNDDRSIGNNQPQIKYSLKTNKTYYYVLMAQNPSETNPDDNFTISVRCAHSSTHTIPGTVTCDTAGISDKIVCDICGETLSGGEEIPAYHSPGSKYLTHMKECPPTCFTDGYTDDTVICQKCNQVLSGTSTPQLTHEYDNDGVCMYCGLTKISSINQRVNLSVKSSQPWKVFSYEADSFGSLAVSVYAVNRGVEIYRYTSYEKLASELSKYIQNYCTDYNSGSSFLSESYRISDDANPTCSIKTGSVYYFLIIPRAAIPESTSISGEFSLGCDHKNIITTKPNRTPYVSCTQDGWSDQAVCETCGRIIEQSEWIQAYDHIDNPKTVTKGAVEASCTSKGYTGDEYCVYCNEMIKKGSDIPSNHDDLESPWIYHIAQKRASCYMPAVSDYYFCSLCGSNIVDPVFIGDKLPHSFDSNGVCTHCGMINNAVLNENYEELLSSDSSFKLLKYTPQVTAKYTINVSADCKYYIALYASEKDFCNDCMAEYNGKSANSSIVTHTGQSLTYQLNGQTDYYIAVGVRDVGTSKKKVTVSIDCNHEHTTVVSGDATCQKDGVTDKIVCDICAKVLNDGVQVSAYGHDSEYTKKAVKNQSEADCTHSGYTGDVYCADCGDLLQSGSVIPSHHEDPSYYVTLDDGVEATCSRKGMTDTVICSECNQVIMPSVQTDRQYSAHNFIDGYCELCGIPEDFLSNDENGAFIVSSVSDLIILAEFLNDANYQNNIDVALNADIDLSDYLVNHKWVPMPFAGGTFSGNGYTISGLDFDDLSSAKSLFTTISGAVIRDLGVEGNIDVSSRNAGLLAIQCVDSKLYNVSASGKVSANGYTGGLTAVAKNSSYNNCVNNAAVSSKTVDSIAGGIASSADNTAFTDCINNGSVSAAVASGGIAAQTNNAALEGCVNNGAVKSDGGSGSAGGIVADDNKSSTVNSCINSDAGSVISSASAGGIISSTDNTVITNCLNEGTVKGNPAGGIAAQLSGGSSVDKCFNSGTVTTIDGGGVSDPIVGDKTDDSNIGDNESSHTHHFESRITTPASCLADGVLTYYCTTCPKTYTQSIPKLGHTVVTDEAVAPTCTSTGLTQGSHCSVCGTVITAQQVIPAAEHTYTASVTAPTCTQAGYTVYTCNVCHSSYVADYTNPTGHSVVYVPGAEATCTSGGATAGSYCAICGVVITSQQATPAYGHSFYSYNVAPTASSQGYTMHVCSRCGGAYADNYVAKLSSSTVYKKPKSTSVKKLTKGKKQFKVTWKKTSSVTGYQVQYSTSKKYTKKTTKSVKIKGYKNTSKTIKKLKGKKKYYVRVRTYKTYKTNGKSKTVYSSWSKTKTVTTK